MKRVLIAAGASLAGVILYNSCIETGLNMYLAMILASVTSGMIYYLVVGWITEHLRRKEKNELREAGFKRITLRNGQAIWRHADGRAIKEWWINEHVAI